MAKEERKWCCTFYLDKIELMESGMFVCHNLNSQVYIHIYLYYYKVTVSVFAYVHRHDTLPVLEATLESQMSVHLSVSH